jgi:hypothetical protein
MFADRTLTGTGRLPTTANEIGSELWQLAFFNGSPTSDHGSIAASPAPVLPGRSERAHRTASGIVRE